MKKISALLFAVAAVTLSACGDPVRDLCLKTAECAGEDDPEAFCDENQDEAEEEASDCQAEADAVTACLNANGTCDELEGTDTKVFGLKALAEGGECEDEQKAFTDCNG